jgi:nudix-type nucleoside diphosphatase (YffH/AdpP family)
MTKNPWAFSLRVLHKGWNTFGIATVTGPDGCHFERALEHHGDATCVLPYDPDRRVALLVRQMRIGPLFCGDAPELDEAAAGGLDGEDPEAAAIREAFEECGVRLTVLEPLGHPYALSGVSSERVWLYLAPYCLADRIASGGGIAQEGEDIQVLEVSLSEMATQATNGTLRDLKTLALIQALQLRRPDLFIS